MVPYNTFNNHLVKPTFLRKTNVTKSGNLRLSQVYLLVC